MCPNCHGVPPEAVCLVVLPKKVLWSICSTFSQLLLVSWHFSTFLILHDLSSLTYPIFQGLMNLNLLWLRRLFSVSWFSNFNFVLLMLGIYSKLPLPSAHFWMLSWLVLCSCPSAECFIFRLASEGREQDADCDYKWNHQRCENFWKDCCGKLMKNEVQF